MMFALLLESAVRSLCLGIVVCLGLKCLRVRSTQVQRIAWTVILVAALLMPLLMQWNTVTLPAPAVTPVWEAVVTPAILTKAPMPLPHSTLPVPRNWSAIFFRVYLLVAGLFLLRLVLGLVLGLRLVRNAAKVTGIDDCRVRVSPGVSTPFTFGSIVLVPPEWITWDEVTRCAVLSHERSHIERRDFHIQLLVSVHQAAFWFSPLAWSLKTRLAELAELESDDAAIIAIEDRMKYAEILAGLANRQASVGLAGVAMARPATVARRVERILAENTVQAGLGCVRRLVLVVCILPLIVLAAGSCLRSQAQVQPPSPPVSPSPLWPNPLAGARIAQIIQIRPGTSEAFALVSSDYKTFWGSQEDSRRAESVRKTVQGDYIWFRQDSKEYVVTDPSSVQQAKDILKTAELAQQELSKRQAELGVQQAKLGEQQAKLGEQQENVRVPVPDLAKVLDELNARLASMAGKESRQNELGDIQARIGDLQSMVANLQARAGEQQARLGQQQALLGAQQAQLGAEQAAIGAQHAQRAQEVFEKMHTLLDETQRKGQARSLP
jgi:beta-lactamase regulating signal transducer with metallopeptidase domain